MILREWKLSSNELETQNKILIDYLRQTGINNAFYYQPGEPEKYWQHDNIRIGVCNLETYGDSTPGIKSIPSKLLEDWSDGNKTILQTFFINYCLRWALYNNLPKISEDMIRQLFKNTRAGQPDYYNMYEAMLYSLYFNFRYSISEKRPAANKYIEEQYNNEFYQNHFRNFIQSAELNILLISTELGAKLINKIYSKENVQLSYQKEPLFLGKTLVVSIHHPAYISYKEITDCINKVLLSLR